ncbi:YEATS domain-containing protein 4-like [Uloborus diversus]|uniref:YEATS domain-containing protein 4-like n=1 Tax=Uloborus diversus TaxID=327109 RepID=UPI0024094A90|nr:YEATS domain-containing protein 4-like [Uloborus diversus]
MESTEAASSSSACKISKASGAIPKTTVTKEINSRVKGKQIVKRLLYGNVAWLLSKKQDADERTHQWTVYLKPYDNEDLSVFIKRVQFVLHDSYAQPYRVCHCPPYSVTETGWGEFEITIKIFFQDSNERPVTLYHFLKLFDRDEDGHIKSKVQTVNSELYEELIFTDPTHKMYKLLLSSLPKTSVLSRHQVEYEEKKARDLQKILKGKEAIKELIATTKLELERVKQDISKLKISMQQNS